MSWHQRLRNFARADRLGRDIDREIAFHVAERVDELVAAGMSEPAARREARRRLGNPAVLRERLREVDMPVWLESLVADVRYAARALRASPGFTLVAVLSLGLGIGANTAIFSLIDAVMLRSLPVSAPHELVQITLDEGEVSFTNPLWEEIRDRQDALAGTFAFSDESFNLAPGGEIRWAGGAMVSGDYFEVLGIGPAAGRVLGPADDVRGCPGRAVLSQAYWRREHGADPAAVGSRISLDGHSFEIVGVSAPGFTGVHVGREAGIFVPLCTAAILRSSWDMLDNRGLWFLTVFGRLPPGGTLAAAQASLAVLAPAVYQAAVPTHWSAEEQREFMAGTLGAIPAATGLSLVRGQYRQALFILLAVVGVVLLIACANVAQLLLARATARQHEISVRLALGSGRTRLARQLLTESLLLALLGALAGLLFARWASARVVGLLSQSGRAVALDVSLDHRVLAFAIAVAVVTGLLFGLAPAWRSARLDPQAAMHGAGRSVAGDGRPRFAESIVVAQIALSMVLVAAAGLLVGSFHRLATLDPGFRAENVLVVRTGWSEVELSEDRAPGFPRELITRLRAIPGVRQAAASSLLPISGTLWNDDVVAEGGADGPAAGTVYFNGVSDGYLETMGTRLLAGRDVDARDGKAAPEVVLVNETLARQFFGEESPLHKLLRVEAHGEPGPPMEIVGVVEDAKYQTLDEELRPTAYLPLEQTELWRPAVDVTLRTEGSPEALRPAVAEALREIDPRLTLELTSLREQVATSLARPRLLATLSGFFGALALTLAVIGLYGTVSYNVARRRNEIGIRIALGAGRGRIVRMVAGEVGRLVTLGVLLGVLLALAATRSVAALLYGVEPSDPRTLALSALALAAVAMTAALVPAWRATGVDPRAALREE